ncbi:MAG: long-chain-fatty-acid--CoA ligase [Peptococcaceae bacterium]|nr:long-chain-fatty-acid--CoA ligase [Peptococcaceae bacterium]
MQVLGDIPRKGAKLYGNRECMVFEGRRLTYKELDERVNRLANHLLSLEIDGLRHIAVLAENCPQFMEICFAAAKAGYVTVPLNFRLANSELVYILKDSEAKAIFFGREYENTAREIAGGAGIHTLVSIDGPAEGCSSYEEMLANSPPTEPAVAVDENQMAILMYTGGTTGLPKGVMLSHRNLMTAAIALTVDYKFDKNEITCFILPMFHASVWPVLCVLMVGGKAAILRRPDLTKILELIQSEKCTHINAVPTIYNWLMQHPALDQFDLSSIRKISYAGSPMAPELLKKMLQKYGEVSFYNGYGLTEAAPTVSVLPPEDHVPEGPPELARRLMSVGREMFMVEAKVVREDGSEVMPGEIGEIVARGKNIMLGYWKRPEQTAEALKGGWLHTGDMGTVDGDGYIYLMDRKHDMIITGGENVYPREVEDVLYSHPAVLEVAVVGVPDEKWGESVKAVVVLKEGMKAEEEELKQFVKARLAGYKCPKSIDFKEVLPKTPVGKIVRNEIKKEYWQNRDRLIN